MCFCVSMELNVPVDKYLHDYHNDWGDNVNRISRMFWVAGAVNTSVLQANKLTGDNIIFA